jgi:cold shock CspA family protein
VNGKISKFLSYRGYGFIDVDESEKDIFFHSSNFRSTGIPRENQVVEFRVIDTPKGKEAVDVQIVTENMEQVSDQEIESELIAVKVYKLDKINGIGPKYLELLDTAGIQTVNSLSENTPKELLTNLLVVNEAKGIVKRPPSLPLVKKWIQTASNWR